jgi:hypothetical protein
MENIWFTFNRNGQRTAWKHNIMAGRNFRISMETAKLMISTGQARIVPAPAGFGA